MKEKVVAIVPAAGLGKRFGGSDRKTFAEISGIPLLIYTLKGLHWTDSVTEIIPALRQEDMKRGLEFIDSQNFHKIKQIAPGGKERQDSVYNALRLIKEDCLVLVHDGVRPFVSAGLIDRLLKEIKRPGPDIAGVIPGLSVKETLKEIDNKGFALSTVRRERFRTIQTPQVFSFAVIKKAYDAAYSEGFCATDDAALVERIGGKIKIIEGDPFNIKVTVPEDMDIVEYLLKKVESRKQKDFF